MIVFTGGGWGVLRMDFSCPILHSSFWIIYLFVIVDIPNKVIIARLMLMLRSCRLP